MKTPLGALVVVIAVAGLGALLWPVLPVAPAPASATTPAADPAGSLRVMPATGPLLFSEPTPASESRSAAQDTVTAIGDSVMLAAAGDLQASLGNITIDAEVGRQVPAALDTLKAIRSSGKLGSVVVIGMGTNGLFTSQQLDEMMELAVGARRVVFVNVKCPRDWEAADNAMLAAAARRYPQIILVDWHAASVNRPELFWDDGIHLRPEGAKVYALLVTAAVNAP